MRRVLLLNADGRDCKSTKIDGAAAELYPAYSTDRDWLLVALYRAASNGISLSPRSVLRVRILDL